MSNSRNENRIEGDRIGKTQGLPAWVFIVVDVIFSILVLANAVHVIGRHGGLAFAFSNVYNIARMIGLFSAPFLFAVIVAAVVAAIRKYALKKRPRFLLAMFATYILFSIVGLSSPTSDRMPITARGKSVTVLKRVEVDFAADPTKVKTADSGMETYICRNSFVMETLSVSKLTDAILLSSQQYSLLATMQSGFEGSHHLVARTETKEMFRHLPALTASYVAETEGGANLTVHTRSFMIDGWIVFLQLACPDSYYGEYKTFLTGLKVFSGSGGTT